MMGSWPGCEETAAGGSLGGTLHTIGRCFELGPKVTSSLGTEVLLGSCWLKSVQDLVLRGSSSMAGDAWVSTPMLLARRSGSSMATGL